jgi:hypothetical protein
MTTNDAHRLATRLWGSRAIVAEERIVGLDEQGATVHVYTVGHASADAYSWAVKGRGITWEQAFADAGVVRFRPRKGATLRP